MNQLPTFEQWQKADNKAAVNSSLVTAILLLIIFAACFLCSCSRYNSSYSRDVHKGCKQTWRMNGYK